MTLGVPRPHGMGFGVGGTPCVGFWCWWDHIYDFRGSKTPWDGLWGWWDPIYDFRGSKTP